MMILTRLTAKSSVYSRNASRACQTRASCHTFRFSREFAQKSQKAQCVGHTESAAHFRGKLLDKREMVAV